VEGHREVRIGVVRSVDRGRYGAGKEANWDAVGTRATWRREWMNDDVG